MSQLDLLPPEPPDPLDRGLLAYCRRHGIPAVLPDTIEAGDAWGANCGPMALAAVLDLPTVEAARPLVQPFRGFTIAWGRSRSSLIGAIQPCWTILA